MLAGQIRSFPRFHGRLCLFWSFCARWLFICSFSDLFVLVSLVLRSLTFFRSLSRSSVFFLLVLRSLAFRSFTFVCFRFILPSLVYRSFVFTLARPLDLQSLAFHSIVFTLVRFCFVRFALARFLRARSFFFVCLVFRRNPTSCLCPFSCAFRYSIVRLFVCFCCRITPALSVLHFLRIWMFIYMFFCFSFCAIFPSPCL